METDFAYVRPIQVQLCHEAAAMGDLEGVKDQVRQLLHSPDVPSVGEKPHPAWLYESLSEAIRQNNVEIVRYLLDENVANGDLPVETAVRWQAFEILELFLRYGWDVNQPMGRNEPPVLGYYFQLLFTYELYLHILSIPLSTSDAKMTDWLLNHGANPNQRCNLDLTPTSYAKSNAPLETIQKLFSRGANIHHGQLLHHAVLRNKPDALEVVRWIVEKGAQIDEIKYENDPKSFREQEPFGLGTPLHRAAESGKVEIVTYLLSMGADSLKLDSKGCTPCFWAEEKGYGEVVDILKEAEDRQLRDLGSPGA